MLEGLGDVSGFDEVDVDADASSLLEESVAADAAVEVESDRIFLLLLLDAVMIGAIKYLFVRHTLTTLLIYVIIITIFE